MTTEKLNADSVEIYTGGNKIASNIVKKKENGEDTSKTLRVPKSNYSSSVP